MIRRAWIIGKRAYLNYLDENGTQYAAAISYYVLFSILPLAILSVSVLGFFFQSADARNTVVNRIVDAVPLSQDEGRSAVEKAVQSVQNASAPVAVAGLIGTLWTASAVFSSIRKALNAIWRVDEHRPFARAKLIDFTQVGVLGAILVASLVLTGVLRAVRNASFDYVGPLAGGNPLWELPPIVLPATLSFVTFALLYRIVPAAHPRWRDVLPGALLATLLFEALKNSFAFYVANFNNFDVVYGSLAGALLFLLFTFLSSNILLMGAELSHTLSRYHLGELDAEIYPAEPQPAVAVRAFRAVKGLFVRE